VNAARLVSKAAIGASLLDSRQRLSDAQLARTLGVGANAVSRWRGGVKPREHSLAGLRVLAQLVADVEQAKREALSRLTQALGDDTVRT
jgi:transcriptional regulator with XRE-family HTH domain